MRRTIYHHLKTPLLDARLVHLCSGKPGQSSGYVRSGCRRCCLGGHRFRSRHLPHDSLNGRTAHGYVRSCQVTSDGACAALRFRTKSTKFLGRPSHGIIRPIPDDSTGKQAAVAAFFHRLDPRAQRIGMQHEPLVSLNDAPTAQAIELHDCQNCGLESGPQG